MGVVFVVDTERRPLAPCHPAQARRLLRAGKAAVWRPYPFTIMRKRPIPDATPEPLRLKIDPGSRITGLALVNDAHGQVVWAAELTHRGQAIRQALLARGRGPALAPPTAHALPPGALRQSAAAGRVAAAADWRISSPGSPACADSAV